MIDYNTAKSHYLRTRDVTLILPYLYEYVVYIDPKTPYTKEEFISLFPVWLHMPVMNLETQKVYPNKNRLSFDLKGKEVFNFLDEKYLK